MINVLRKYGYRIAHDVRYPSLLDGNEKPEMLHIMHRNAKYSKLDALTYYGERTILVGDVVEAINRMRHRMASGVIANAVWDSTDDENDIEFWKQILAYCHRTGVKVITKSEAFDICYNHKIEAGNLISNSEFRNTLKEFKPNCNDSNPDGYIGDCYTKERTGHTELCINGITKYSHYGIPIGCIEYKVMARGKGRVDFYAIRNKTQFNHEDELITSLKICSNEYKEEKIDFFIQDASLTDYECQYEGYGEKICGIRIVYIGTMEVYHIQMIKK